MNQSYSWPGEQEWNKNSFLFTWDKSNFYSWLLFLSSHPNSFRQATYEGARIYGITRSAPVLYYPLSTISSQLSRSQLLFSGGVGAAPIIALLWALALFRDAIKVGDFSSILPLQDCRAHVKNNDEQPPPSFTPPKPKGLSFGRLILNRYCYKYLQGPTSNRWL